MSSTRLSISLRFNLMPRLRMASAIRSRVSVPFSGAKRIPQAAPTAAPPKNAARMLRPFIVEWCLRVNTILWVQGFVRGLCKRGLTQTSLQNYGFIPNGDKLRPLFFVKWHKIGHLKIFSKRLCRRRGRLLYFCIAYGVPVKLPGQGPVLALACQNANLTPIII